MGEVAVTEDGVVWLVQVYGCWGSCLRCMVHASSRKVYGACFHRCIVHAFIGVWCMLSCPCFIALLQTPPPTNDLLTHLCFLRLCALLLQSTWWGGGEQGEGAPVSIIDNMRWSHALWVWFAVRSRGLLSGLVNPFRCLFS